MEFEGGEVIKEKDPYFHDEIVKVINYLASTYGDKYAKADLDTKGILLSETLGKGFNIGNAFKYLSRYSTTGYSKSENKEDLYKVIHYCVFELQRRTKYEH